MGWGNGHGSEASPPDEGTTAERLGDPFTKGAHCISNGNKDLHGQTFTEKSVNTMLLQPTGKLFNAHL